MLIILINTISIISPLIHRFNVEIFRSLLDSGRKLNFVLSVLNTGAQKHLQDYQTLYLKARMCEVLSTAFKQTSIGTVSVAKHEETATESECHIAILF